MANFAKEKIAKHKQQQQEEAQAEKKSLHEDQLRNSVNREPFMTKMIRLHRQDPQKLTDYHLFMVAQSNVIAGFDTTAISLASTMYHLIKTPRVLQNLRNEINAARELGKLSERITFHESQDLPYFQAVIKEVLRVHAAAGLPFWRVVPEGGVDLEGLHFPEGTVLGASSWVYHNNEDVFANPTEFCPERWMGLDEAKLKAMNEMYMPVSLSDVGVDFY